MTYYAFRRRGTNIFFKGKSTIGEGNPRLYHYKPHESWLPQRYDRDKCKYVSDNTDWEIVVYHVQEVGTL